MTSGAMKKRIPVVYVGGMGRSGSTLVERAMAQLQGFVGIGEVAYLWERGVENDELCGCGNPFSQCDFWQSVGERAFGGWDRVDTARVAQLGRRVNDVKFVPRLLLPARVGGLAEPLKDYLSYYERLYEAVVEVSGADVVVDSSKITSLVYILSHSERLTPRLLHILRDPRAVAYSWTKVVKRPEVHGDEEAYMPRYSPGYIGLLYSGHHVLLEALRIRGVPSVNVRYEDFVKEPLTSLQAACAGLGVPFDPSSLQTDSPTTLNLQSVHTVSGNPSRFQTGDIQVRHDGSWQRAMPAKERRLVAALTAPLMLAYRYPAPTPAAAETQVTPEPAVWPSVTVIVPTHDRPQLVRRAIDSVVAQDYPGPLDISVVFDRAEPEQALASDDPNRPVRLTTNHRTPGLAGARNTGIVGAKGDLVAFLDDDDHWLPTKLRRQVGALLNNASANFATTAMVVDYEDKSIPRLAGRSSVAHRDLIRSRLAMLHSSSFLARREAMTGVIGLVDETMPGSMAEDWDLLLRAAQDHDIVHLDEPLIRVQWGPTSYFADRWEARNDARQWMLQHHPEIKGDPKGAGLAYGKLAYGHAMLGERREALSWARKAARANWREPRAVLATLVAAKLVSGQWIVDQLNRRGHGI